MSGSRRQLAIINITLLIVLIILITAILRLNPLIQNSLEPYAYQGIAKFNLFYLLENGHILPSPRGESLLLIYSAIWTIIFHPTLVQDLLIASIYQSLTFAIIILLFAKQKNEITEIGLGTIALIIAFSNLATPDIILRLSGWNGPYAWILFFLFIYISFFKSKNATNSFISLLLLASIPLIYFSESVFIAVILAFSYSFEIISKRKIFSRNLIIFFLIFFSAWLMYMSFGGINIIADSINNVRYLLLLESRILELKYIAGGTADTFIKNALSNILAFTPLIYLIIKAHRFLDRKLQDFFLVSLSAIGSLSIMFFAWMGLTGVFQRIPLYFILISIIVFSSIITIKNKSINVNERLLLIFFVILAMIVSSFAYGTSPYTATSPTFGEANGAHWLMDKITKNATIFSEFQLSALFSSRGYETITLNDEIISAMTINRLLEQLFYDKGSPKEGINKLESIYLQKINYLFLSKSNTKRFPGIKGMDYNYLPAPSDYLNRYREFDKIYQNLDSNILIN